MNFWLTEVPPGTVLLHTVRLLEATGAQAKSLPGSAGKPNRIKNVHRSIKHRRHRSTRDLSQEFIMKKTALTKDDWHMFPEKLNHLENLLEMISEE
jgi:hypothetical protein